MSFIVSIFQSSSCTELYLKAVLAIYMKNNLLFFKFLLLLSLISRIGVGSNNKQKHNLLQYIQFTWQVFLKYTFKYSASNNLNFSTILWLKVCGEHGQNCSQEPADASLWRDLPSAAERWRRVCHQHQVKFHTLLFLFLSPSVTSYKSSPPSPPFSACPCFFNSA